MDSSFIDDAVTKCLNNVTVIFFDVRFDHLQYTKVFIFQVSVEECQDIAKQLKGRKDGLAC